MTSNYSHSFKYDEALSLITIVMHGEITLQNSFDVLSKVVSENTYPDNLYILQDLRNGTLKMSQTEIHLLEAFQRQYIANFKQVKIALVLPEDPQGSNLMAYYQSILSNENCISKTFSSREQAKLWVTEDTLIEA